MRGSSSFWQYCGSRHSGSSDFLDGGGGIGGVAIEAAGIGGTEQSRSLSGGRGPTNKQYMRSVGRSLF